MKVIVDRHGNEIEVGPRGLPAYKRPLVKMGGILFYKPTSATGLDPTANEMAIRSSDRRRVAVTLPKLRYMDR